MDNKKVNKIVNQIWGTTKLLDAMDKKQNQYPEHMRPLYALKLLETVIIKEKESIILKVGNDLDKIKKHFLFRKKEIGFNNKITEKDNYSLKDVVDNDLAKFTQELGDYLNAFDEKTQEILGTENYKGKYLKFIQRKDELIGDKGKHFESYFKYCRAWANIDFMTCTMEEIKFIDREIKRKWADISAVQAGDHYTPEDISDLVSDIVCYYYKPNSEETNLYDMACGGGNMLFNVEDKIIEKSKEFIDKPYVETYGQEIDSELYALALVAGRFREDVTIEKNNSLFEEVKDDEQNSIKMDFVVSNPPHGKSWGGKALKKKVNDLLGEDLGDFYIATPSTSDSQLLFLQHAIYKLKENGVAVIVSNGSSLFSGNAGGGESKVRKYVLDNDYLEALIQLPESEFFNTNITTYIWVINKNKKEERKNKILLINASAMHEELKKNKGDKRNYIDENNRYKIVNLLNDFKDSENSKIFNRSYFYYNKQNLDVINIDISGKTIETILPLNKKGEKYPIKLENISDVLIEGKSMRSLFAILLFEELFVSKKISDIGNEDVSESFKKMLNNVYKKLLNFFSCKSHEDILVKKEDVEYYFNNKKDTIIKKTEKTEEELGCGYIEIEKKFEPANKSRKERVRFIIRIKPIISDDSELIPYSFDSDENEKNIQEFLDKWVDRPYERKQNVVGVEFNFNKIFYEPESLREIDEIESDLVKSYKNFSSLMKDLIDVSKYD